MTRCFLLLICFLIPSLHSSDQNWPEWDTRRAPKPWVDPIPAPDDPTDPTEPGPYPPPPPFPPPPPEPLPFRPGTDHLIKLIEELKKEITQLKRRVSRLESRLRSQKPHQKDQDTCQAAVLKIRKASAKYFSDRGKALEFDGKMTPFQILLEDGFLFELPNAWRNIRGRLPGTITCLP